MTKYNKRNGNMSTDNIVGVYTSMHLAPLRVSVRAQAHRPTVNIACLLIKVDPPIRKAMTL